MTSTPACQIGVFQPKRTGACLVEGGKPVSRLLPTTTQSGTLAATRSRLQATPVPPDRYSLQQILDDRRDRPCWQGQDTVRFDEPPLLALSPGRAAGCPFSPERAAVPSGRAPCLSHSTRRRLITMNHPLLSWWAGGVLSPTRSVDVLPATSGSCRRQVRPLARPKNVCGAPSRPLVRRTSRRRGRQTQRTTEEGQQRNRGASSIPQASFLKVPAWLAVVW